MLYKGYIYEHLEYVVEAPSATRAEERISDYTKEDWNMIWAEKLILPEGVSVEMFCRENRLVYLTYVKEDS